MPPSGISHECLNVRMQQRSGPPLLGCEQLKGSYIEAVSTTPAGLGYATANDLTTAASNLPRGGPTVLTTAELAIDMRGARFLHRSGPAFVDALDSWDSEAELTVPKKKTCRD